MKHILLFDNYTGYIITYLDRRAYDLYCYRDENDPHIGEHHHISDFVSDKQEFLEYYKKAKIDIRKDNLKQLSKYYHD